ATAIPTATIRPRNRLRRHFTMAMQATTDTHGRPTTKTDRPSKVATMTFTAARAARTAGPTSWRYSRARRGRRSIAGFRRPIARDGYVTANIRNASGTRSVLTG